MADANVAKIFFEKKDPQSGFFFFFTPCILDAHIFMKDIAPILQSLGLQGSEIKTYLTALERGPSTVIDLSKATKLSRQATYVAIETLEKRGLMSSVLHGKKRFYAGEHPEKLLAYAKRHEIEMQGRVRDLERMLPELELQIGGEKPMVRVFEGKEGIREIIEDIRTSVDKDSVEITDYDAMHTILTPDDLEGLRNEIQKRGITIRTMLAGETVPTAFKKKSERYILPKEFFGFHSNIGIYGNKIAMVTFEGKMYSVLIESAPLVSALRVLFGLALKGAEEFRHEQDGIVEK